MNRIAYWAVCSLALFVGGSVVAQSTSGIIRGTVVDPSGAVVPGAKVTIDNPVSHFNVTATSDPDGNFAFNNVPYNNYHVSASRSGFQDGSQDVNLRSTVPVDLKLELTLGTTNETVVVNGSSAQDLLNVAPVANTNIDRGLFDKVPESGTSSLSSMVTASSPGVVGDSDGQMHGMGDHAQNSFSVDGQPISDQQSKVFSNQLPLDAVQSLSVIAGAPPAEFGDKTSLVIVVTTRSGLGATQPHGEVTASYGSFGSSNLGFNLLYGGANWGNFVSVSGMNTSRFLDPPEFSAMHDKGNQENLWDRFDLKPSTADTLSLNFGLTRSWFQTPTSFDGQDATAWSGLVVNNNGLGPNGLPVGSQDQHSKINTINISPSWTRLLNSSMVYTLGVFVRSDTYNYYPSRNPFADFTPDLQTESIGQARKLTNVGVRSDLSYVKGIHNLKVGIVYQHTLLSEKDTLAIVDPLFNAPCIAADGTAVTSPSITNPSNCTGAYLPNPSFSPLLGCYDLTRTATLPTSDGCPGPRSIPYTFSGTGDIAQFAGYIQDAITMKQWTFNVGARLDWYNGFSTETQIEPRVGIAYNLKNTGTVVRISYARTMETPFNENQVLASTGCQDPVINQLMGAAQGYPCLSAPGKPGRRDEYHAGLEQAFGRHLVIDAEYIWKYTHRAYDFSVLGATPITFPIEWYSSKIPGYTVRATVPTIHGFTAYVVMASVAARFFTPQVAGIGVTPTSTGTSSVFRIDHDQNFESTAHAQYQIGKNGPWIGFNWRFDSGEVAGPVPCAGGDCNNGPNGTNSIVDVSDLTPDQQYQAGLFCGGVYATPYKGISANGLCPASSYGSTLLKIPAAGTENNDHNPPRVAPRNLFDVSIGHDNLFKGDRYKWSLRLAVVNLTNDYALYNFLSTFSGTHYVTPRTLTATVGFHF
jgi:hypothetical protein